MVHLALYQPDIPQNLGTIIRLCACLDMTLHIIEPCGFPLDDRKLKRAAMDYAAQATIMRHADWQHFLQSKPESARLLLLTTKSAEPYTDITYRPDDILLFGRESAGVPDEAHKTADKRLTIPMKNDCRSLNLALSAAMVAGEAARQLA